MSNKESEGECFRVLIDEVRRISAMQYRYTLTAQLLSCVSNAFTMGKPIDCSYSCDNIGDLQMSAALGD